MPKILGLMTHRLQPLDRYFHIVKTAKKEGFNDVIVFTPQQVNVKRREIKAYCLRKGRWVPKITSYPTILYDRGYYHSGRQYDMALDIMENRGIPLVSYDTADKWTVQQQLSSSPTLSAYLIPSQLLESANDAFTMLDKYSTVIIKPIDGMQGKGVMQLSRRNGYYVLKEDDNPFVKLPRQLMLEKLERLIRSDKYLVQQWVDIRSRRGNVYDIRVLMQKDYRGKWKLAGKAVRLGKKGKIVSNLASGGTAVPVVEFLQNQFGRKMAKKLNQKLRKLSFEICSHIENVTGRHYEEFGLDIGIDREGHIWLIEVNRKPGRKILSRVGTRRTAKKGFLRPIQFAYSLVRNQVRRQMRMKI